MMRPLCLRFASRPSKFRHGLTLVEVLVVIAVISVMIAVLLPTLSVAREQARGVVCQSHERRLWQGFLLFAADHDNRLPGNQNDRTPLDPSYTDWLGPNTPMWWDTWSTAPQQGTLFPYMNHDYAAYLCPSLESAPPPGYEMGSGAGSNGRFDYVAFIAFDGCHLDRVPLTATFTYSDGTTISLPTPIICEEEAWTINLRDMEGNHCDGDEMGHQHRGGCYYVSPDGAVNWFSEPYDTGAWCWYVTTQKGYPWCLGYDGTQAGWFETR